MGLYLTYDETDTFLTRQVANSQVWDNANEVWVVGGEEIKAFFIRMADVYWAKATAERAEYSHEAYEAAREVLYSILSDLGFDGTEVLASSAWHDNMSRGQGWNALVAAINYAISRLF